MAGASKIERIAELTAVITSAAPWIGGPVAEIIGGVATELKIQRVTSFVKDVLAHVEKVRSAQSEAFLRTEDFVDIFEKTAEAVASERDEEKRKLFSRYVLNNIAAPAIAYNHRLKCLRVLEQVDTRHVDLLRALLLTPTPIEALVGMSTPGYTLQKRIPYLQNDITTLVYETNTLGLTNIKIEYLSLNMTGNGASDLRSRVTPFGNEFIGFIRG